MERGVNGRKSFHPLISAVRASFVFYSVAY